MVTGRQDGRGRMGAAAILGLLLVAFAYPVAPSAEGTNPEASGQAWAANGPEMMSFQGDLRDGAGKPLNGTYDMIFRFFDSATDGTLLLTDSHSAPGSVTITEGLFDTILGGGALTPGSQPSLGAVFVHLPSVWLEIQVGSETLSPRMQITSAAYAQNASTLEGKPAAEFAGATHGHTGSDITGPVAEATAAVEAGNADTLDGQHAEAFAVTAHAHDATAISSGTLPAARGGTGLASPGTSGNLLTSNGIAWTSSTPPTAAASGAVVDTANTTLTRSGAGTAGSPFKLALNLTNANTWSGPQTFTADTAFPGSGIWTSSGSVGIGTVTPQASFKLDVRSPLSNGIAIQGTGPGAGGYFKDSDDSGYAELGVGDTGIDAGGKTMGGAFYDGDGSGTAFVGYGDRGIHAEGNEMGGYFKEKDGSGMAMVAGGERGIWGEGTVGGGYFKDANSSGFAWVGYGDLGVSATGIEAGGVFVDGDDGGFARVGVGESGIDAYGPGRGGYFKDMYDSGYSYVAIDDYGIQGFGDYAGGHFDDSNSTSWADVSYSTYKIFGSGTVSFVQNHPSEKDKVIVYACPEGDEVATYTRGTAKLVNGEARVMLGETFRWVTNPDIGLTVHLTPVGDWSDLYVKQKSTTELVVRSKSGARDAAFDYLVYGLRIGFEESSIVQEKRRESFIPSFKDHRERYAKYPALRGFTAFERFKMMESAVRGVGPETLNLSRAEALKATIHEYDPATDPPEHELFGHGPGPLPSPAQAGQIAEKRAPEPTRLASPNSLPGAEVVRRKGSDKAGQAPPAILAPSLVPERFPVCDPVEAGDVLVSSAAHPGFFCLARSASDPGVFGIVKGEHLPPSYPATESEEAAVTPSAEVALSGVAVCKVDATYGPIRVNDLLVTSATPGHAMVARPTLVNGIPIVASGTLVGKALEPLESGMGLIRVLVMLR